MKIKVSPVKDLAMVFLITAEFVFVIRCIASAERAERVYNGVLSCFFAVMLIGMILDHRNRSLTADTDEIVYSNMWGKQTRVKYDEITSVKISSNGRVGDTRTEFYRRQECVGYCCSCDVNYASLMKYLLTIMPNKIVWGDGTVR